MVTEGETFTSEEKFSDKSCGDDTIYGGEVDGDIERGTALEGRGRGGTGRDIRGH